MQLHADDARRLLAGARVGHLATADRAAVPHVVAAVFVLDGDHLYTAVDAKPKRSVNLRRLRNLRENPNATFLVDRYDDDWSRLWWVRADGTARIIEDPDGMRGPLDLLAAKYPQYRASRPAGPLIALMVTRVTGWSAQG